MAHCVSGIVMLDRGNRMLPHMLVFRYILFALAAASFAVRDLVVIVMEAKIISGCRNYDISYCSGILQLLSMKLNVVGV